MWNSSSFVELKLRVCRPTVNALAATDPLLFETSSCAMQNHAPAPAPARHSVGVSALSRAGEEAVRDTLSLADRARITQRSPWRARHRPVARATHRAAVAPSVGVLRDEGFLVVSKRSRAARPPSRQLGTRGGRPRHRPRFIVAEMLATSDQVISPVSGNGRSVAIGLTRRARSGGKS